jgi:hypothetical protein
LPSFFIIRLPTSLKKLFSQLKSNKKEFLVKKKEKISDDKEEKFFSIHRVGKKDKKEEKFFIRFAALVMRRAHTKK